MATRAFVVPRRLDVNGLHLHVSDLKPNNSQRNSIYEGEGQTFVLKYSHDRPGVTVVSGDAYVSGSLTTSPLSSTDYGDNDGGGSVGSVGSYESIVTQACDFGLLAYLRDVVHVNPGGDSDFLTTGEALNIVTDILARVVAGNSVTLADINTIINNRVAGADSDLDGAGAGSLSRGSVEEVLRILSGEVYRVRDNTILADQNGAFLSLADRQNLVDTTTTGVTFYASGEFMDYTNNGYRNVPALALTGAVRSSVRSGVLSRLVASFTVLNPNFAYAAGDVTVLRPRALTISGANVAATGAAAVVVVYDSAGNVVA